MNKTYISVNKQKLHDALLENLRSMNEAELNELFGLGGPKKPKQELTAEYIRNADGGELADLLAEYCNYWMASAGESLDKAIMPAVNALFNTCKEKKEDGTKLMKAIVLACRKALTGAYDKTLDGVKALPRILLMGVALTVKFGANGIDLGVNAAKAIYSAIVTWVKDTYGKCKDGVEKAWDATKDKMVLCAKVLMAVGVLCAYKVAGAAQTLGALVKEIVNDAKDGVNAAVLIVRMWFAAKAEAVTAWVKETVADAKNKVVEVWNGMEKAVTKGWNNAVSKIVDWCNSIKLTVNKIVDKVADTMTAAGDAIVGAKDKVVVASIGKAVKMLSKNYSEDDIIAIVRKALKEGVRFEADGSFIVNEKYYTSTNLKPVLG